MKPVHGHLLTATAGIALGMAAAFSPGIVFILFLAAGTAFGLHRFSRREDRRFLAGLFLAGFLLRATLSVALDLGSVLVEGKFPGRAGPVREWSLGVRDATRGYLRMGDSDYYSQRAFAFAQHMEGNREQVVVFRLNQYGWNGYVDLMGMFYYLFGFSPVAVKGLNWLLGGWMGLLVFLILRERFHREIAKWSAVAVAFFPSLLLWSVSNLKDTLLIFLTLLAMLLFVRLDQAKKGKAFFLRYLALLAAVLALHGLVREGLFMILAIAFMGAWILARIRMNQRALWVCGGAAIGLGAWPAFQEIFGLKVRAILAQLFHKHIGYAVSAGMVYPFLPADFYAGKFNANWVETGGQYGGVAKGIVKALFHFFVEPMPSRFDRPIHLLGLPQLVVWYGILLFALIGVAICLRRGARKTLFLFLPMLFLSFVIALTCGNVGTLFRVRDLVTPFILILACAGLWVSFYGSRGLFAGSGEGTRERDAVRGSRLARWLSKGWSMLRAGTAPWRERGRRVFEGGLSGPFSERLGLLLTMAVLVNSVGTLLLQHPWTFWSAGFRIGLLVLGLWALRISSDWKSLKEESKIRAFHEPADAS